VQAQRLTLMLTIASAFTGSLSASTIISGTFDLDGSITATLNTITWTSDGGTAGQGTIENNSDLTGSFIGLGDTNVTIAELNRATEPVGITFAAQNFINFLAAPTFPTLMINYIDAGADTSTNCMAAPVVGQTCTPAVTGGSPFGFQNTGPGGPGSPDVTGSTATFTFSGMTSDGLSTWSGIFTAQFNEPFQTVLADLSNPNFSVTNSYSDSNLVITLIPSSVPEPGGLTLMAVGLVLLVAGRVRLQRKASR
jgi:hypothetical protein